MTRIKIEVDATVTEGTDLNKLRQRVADQLRNIGNPVREDEGITTVNQVRVHEGAKTTLVSVNTQAWGEESFYIGSVVVRDDLPFMTGNVEDLELALGDLWTEWKETFDDEAEPNDSDFIDWLTEKEGFEPLAPSDEALTVTLDV